MNKIGKRIIKYMIIVNLIVAVVGILLTSFIVPKIYINNEYSDLEKVSDYVLEAAKNDTKVDLANIYAVLIDGDSITNMCKPSGNGKGHMAQMGGMNNHMKDIDFSTINGKEIFRDKNDNYYIGVKIKSEYGDIVVYKDYEEIRSLIKSINFIMILIFLFSMILSSIISLCLGKKFSKPIVELQKRADDISKGIYTKSLDINTKDEIQELNLSIDKMSHELERKDKLQREFISNVSHDLKTPLSVIRANGEVIKDGLVEGKDLIDYATNIIDEVDILTDLVSEILVLSKIRENKSLINPTYTNFMDFINESYYKLKSTLNLNERLVLKNEIEDSKIIAPIDNIYLYRVLSNFITNAIKHSKSDDNIILGIRNLETGIEVYIKDYGVGIDEAYQKDIWERYYKGEKSGGMGLGLAISKEILISHNFIYGVRSKYNKGCEFYFVVPNKLIKK